MRTRARIRRWSRLLVLHAVTCTALASCAQDERPSPPNLDAIVDAYEHPDAELDVAQVEGAVDEAIGIHLALRLTDRLRFIRDAVGNTSKGFGANGLNVDLGIDLEGFVSIRTVCPGSTPDQRDRARDGDIELNARIQENALGPVAFGNAAACTFLLPEIPLPAWYPSVPIAGKVARLDGPIAMHFGRLSLGDPIVLSPVIVVSGALTVGDLAPLSNFDFRVPGEGIETRVTLPDGSHAVVFANNTQIGIREKRGRWICALGTRTTCLPEF